MTPTPKPGASPESVSGPTPHLAPPALERTASSTSHRSHRSTRSIPHPQQSTYTYAGNALAPRLGSGLAAREVQAEAERRAERHRHHHHKDGGDKHRPASASPSRPVGAAHSARNRSRSRSPVSTCSSDGYSDASASDADASDADASDEEWDNMRDGSVSRRPKWSRPALRWVLPFVLATTLSLGMSLATRAELLLDLACLVHPPRMPERSTDAAAVVTLLDGFTSPAPDWAYLSPIAQAPATLLGHPGAVTGAHAPDVFVPGHGPGPALGTPTPAPGAPALSPAEKWFLGAQRDIYEYILGRRAPTGGSNDTNTPLPLPSDPTPGKGGNKTPQDNHPSPYPEIDPATCKRDAGVQRAAAKLQQIITVSAGLLSAITTGRWARFSDHHGRTRVLAVAAIGFMINDLCFFLIASYPRLVVQTRLWIMLLGPVLEGLLGGFSTAIAGMHAYISDVTPDGSRATPFSRLGAAVMGGMAVGPVLGSLLIRVSGNILSPFWITICLHAFSTITLLFVVPESLSSDSRAHLRKREATARQATRERDDAQRAWEHSGDNHGDRMPESSGFSRLSTPLRSTRAARRTLGVATRFLRASLTPLQPLTIFVPARKPGGGRDWNLFLLAILNFVVSLLMGVIQVKAQYTFWAFGWTPAELGPYLSFISIARLTTLLGIVPLLMKVIKPYFQERTVVEVASDDADSSAWRVEGGATPEGSSAPVSRAATERTPLLTGGGDNGTEVPAAPVKPKRSAQLDVWILRGCILLEITGYAILGANAHASQGMFVLGSGIVALAAPAPPAANSLALAFLEHKRDSGRLFGAFAVIQAIGANLIAPLVFFSIFSATVSTYAPTVFVVAAGLLAVAAAAISAIRVPRVPHHIARGRARARAQARRVRSRRALQD